MKSKIVSIIAAAALSASLTAQELSISSTVGFESVYSFRGTKLANEIFHGAVDLSYGDFYTGIWTAQPVTGSEENEIDFYGGYGFEVTETISIDLGGTVYYYPEAGSGEESTFEAFLGAAFDTILSPSAYIYYDFDLETLTVEGSISHKVKLAKSTYLKLKAYLGQFDPEDGKEKYYFGAKADLVYKFNDSTTGSIGVRISDQEKKSSKLYWGASFSAGF
ncbi:MAG: TorF family putative porin [Verrucomicrobiota bacterium]